jgi:uncharacterized protein YndB with AHSA1/START domain
MSEKPIRKTIIIDAPVAKVWQVFTDAAVTKLMGGSYVTDWKPGSSLGWRANSGQMYTNGKILGIEKEKMIEHSLIDMGDSSNTICIIRYHFSAKDGKTLLEATETPQRPWSQKQYTDASDGWDAALKLVKDIAERI